MKHITTTMLLLVVASLSFNTVYADVVQLPQLPTANMVDIKTYVQYSSNSTYVVNIAVMYQVDSPIEVPNTISWMDITGQVHTINLSEDFKISNGIFDEIEEQAGGETIADRANKIIEKAKKEREDVTAELYKDALLCTYGDDPATPEIEGRSVWQANHQFEISEEMEYFKQLPDSYQEREFILKTQECETFVNSWMYNNAQYNSIAQAQEDTDIKPWTLDETNSPDTPDPITAEDLKAEEKKALDFKCSLQGTYQGLCSDYLHGDKYVPTFSRPSWYGTYENMRDSSPELADALEDALITQCTVYYPIYSATDAVELPAWLAHCEETK